jgi:hypothetical protein
LQQLLLAPKNGQQLHDSLQSALAESEDAE